MERRFNRSCQYRNQNNNVLPVILYLTLPGVNVHQNFRNDTHRNVKHQKRKRDFLRMKQFNEQKTVCSMFPFYSLENEDIQNILTQPAPVHFKQTNSKLDKLKNCDILQENEKLKSLNMELNDNFKTLHENQLCEKSVLQCKLTEMQNEIASLKIECSNLQLKLFVVWPMLFSLIFVDV